MLSSSTATILSNLDTQNPESFKDALTQLTDHFLEQWRDKARSMMHNKLPGEYRANSIITDDILNDAFRRFTKHLKEDPANLPQNRVHIEAVFALNIRYAIQDAIRNIIKHRREIPSCDRSDQEGAETFGEGREAVARNGGSNEINRLEAFFKAIESLPKKEYRPGCGLDATVLCERRLFPNESCAEIARKYEFDRRTIARYWVRLLRVLHQKIEADFTASDFGTRPMVAEVSPEAGGDLPDLKPGDILLNCNQIVFYNAISLQLHWIV